MSRRSRVLRRILLLALAVYLICSVAAVQVMNAALFGRADEPDGLTVRYADVAADYPRQTVTFSSGSAQLTGWLYPAEDAAALVVIAHGLGADAETYLPETMHFVDEGYSVLTYDATGTGASGGSGTRGLAQSALDLDAALTRAEQEGLPILLFGHSWGGYAAARPFGVGPPPPRSPGGFPILAFGPRGGRLGRRGCAGRQPRRDSLRLRGRI